MTSDSRLRYLQADHVEAPLREFSAAEVLDAGGQNLGSIDGVLVDPAQRKAVYLVIRRNGLLRRRELLPLADLHVEPARDALRLTSPAQLEQFDPRQYPDFSDDDLVTALFADVAA